MLRKFPITILRNLPLFQLTLSPVLATIIFILACLAGHRYRYVWKNEGPTWQLWAYGLVSAIALLTLAFIPMSASVLG